MIRPPAFPARKRSGSGPAPGSSSAQTAESRTSTATTMPWRRREVRATSTLDSETCFGIPLFREEPALSALLPPGGAHPRVRAGARRGTVLGQEGEGVLVHEDPEGGGEVYDLRFHAVRRFVFVCVHVSSHASSPRSVGFVYPSFRQMFWVG